MHLLKHLFSWLADSLNSGTTALVPRKLSSAVGTFFLHYHLLWQNSIHHLATFLASRTFHDPQTLTRPESLVSSCEAMLEKNVQALLWVTSSIMEDVVRVEWNSTKKFVPISCFTLRANFPSLGLYDSAVSQLKDAAIVLSICLGHRDISVEVFGDTVKCLQVSCLFCRVQRLSVN